MSILMNKRKMTAACDVEGDVQRSHFRTKNYVRLQLNAVVTTSGSHNILKHVQKLFCDYAR